MIPTTLPHNEVIDFTCVRVRRSGAVGSSINACSFIEFKEAVNTPDIRNALLVDGAEPLETTPENVAQIIKSDIQRFTKLAKQVGMTVD